MTCLCYTDETVISKVQDDDDDEVEDYEYKQKMSSNNVIQAKIDETLLECKVLFVVYIMVQLVHQFKLQIK